MAEGSEVCFYEDNHEHRDLWFSALEEEVLCVFMWFVRSLEKDEPVRFTDGLKIVFIGWFTLTQQTAIGLTH